MHATVKKPFEQNKIGLLNKADCSISGYFCIINTIKTSEKWNKTIIRERCKKH